MFKKSPESSQLNLFSSTKSFLSGKSLTLYEDKKAWHNQFREQVTNRIDENIFRPLYCENNGTPNSPIRVLIAMMILKEAEGLSDQKLFENCRFNMLTRSALGLMNADDPVPAASTYYLFRKHIYNYAKENSKNLFDIVFAQITKDQCITFDVSGKRIRMDSKLLGSNIAWLSRYELIHETVRVFYKEAEQSGKLNISTKEKLDDLLKINGNKIVYTSSNKEIKNRIQEFGEIIYSMLTLFSSSTSDKFQTLQRVFNEQYQVDENKIVVSREKEEISAQSVQSPHDPDCHFRNKSGNKVKGYTSNVTESCDDDKNINLITNVDVCEASKPDVDFLQKDIKKSQEVLPNKIEAVHADGAYHNPKNQKFCKDNKINLYLHALQGTKGRYQFNFQMDGKLSIFDTLTNEEIIPVKIIGKNNTIKWRIKTSKGYRYFLQKEVDNYQIRKKIEETPIEILQKRNNVEATIFQLGYHYPNNKSRYRGLIKHQMWANIRCLWVNFVRILKYIEQLCKKTAFLPEFKVKLLFTNLYFVLKSILMEILRLLSPIPENIKISTF